MAAPSTPRRRVLRKHISDEKAPCPFKPVLSFDLAHLDSTPLLKRRRATELKDVSVDKPMAEPQGKLTDKPPSSLTPAVSPYPLVGRENECKTLDEFFQRTLVLGEKGGGVTGGNIYVSGGPGTGKTCCVRAATDAWQRKNPSQPAKIIEVNCMELTQRSPMGLLQRVLQIVCAQSGSATGQVRASGPALLAQVAKELASLSQRIIIIADEVDQLVSKRPTGGAGAGHALEPIFALSRSQGPPAIALVAIANSVDLLQRGSAPVDAALCDTLLFEPYGVDQLRKIFKARLDQAGEAGASAAKVLGPVGMELRIRQVAKRSGDCRQVVYACEEALFEASALAAEEEERKERNGGAKEEPLVAAKTPPKTMPVKSMLNDPLNSISQLPHEQQVLLCALASAKGEAVRFTDVCAKYKALCRQLHQPDNLASKDQVSSALGALEQRGLLSIRTKKAGNGRRGRQLCRTDSNSDSVVELAVSCKALREKMSVANPTLEKCLQ